MAFLLLTLYKALQRLLLSLFFLSWAQISKAYAIYNHYYHYFYYSNVISNQTTSQLWQQPVQTSHKKKNNNTGLTSLFTTASTSILQPLLPPPSCVVYKHKAQATAHSHPPECTPQCKTILRYNILCSSIFFPYKQCLTQVLKKSLRTRIVNKNDIYYCCLLFHTQ